MVKKKDAPTRDKQPRSLDPRTDKKGFRVLTDEHDFYQLFGLKDPSKKEDFARMLADSQKDSRQQALMSEKKAPASQPKPLTVREQIKNYPPPQAELDLHGSTAAEAEARTEAFIQKAVLVNMRTLRIIVGKGLHSPKKAILPDVVERKVLQLKQKKLVLGYAWEKKDKSKSGALVVYLPRGAGK